MSEELQRLYNTLEQIETKGDSTITMSTCLQYLRNLITKSKTKDAETVSQEADIAE